ncbi:MAG: hypothetical protein A2033_15185 [Bacteroidetes bacterium GWA2_31_9]|nr:MAG: hypothetical protein A2033_15185 [Bacteroidetes bacterium GWA2_31_9]
MLSATNILGCTGYNTKFGFISVQTASPSFTVIDSTLCSSDSVFFINTTPGENQNYLWNFGDGNTSTDANPVYFYTDSGTYNVSLKVIDTVGCDTTFVKYDYIKKQSNPIANFVADTLNADCYPLIVSFSDNSGSPYSSAWNWDFGDNATSTLSSPIHAFSRPGQFDVKMIVSTSFGCTDSIIKTEYIIVKGPYADFSFISPVVCKETPVAFYIDTLLDVDQFSWDFGDGVVVPGTGDTIYHTYSDYGFLYPQLIYSDSSNTCPQFARDSITINLVNSGFTISDSLLCSGSSLNFINSSFGDIFYDWDFGDGIHSGIENPTHSYSGPGNYTVYLTVSDQYACSDIDSLPVTVHPLPNYLALNDSIKCDHDTIILNAGVGFASYLWSNNSTLQTLEIAHQGQYTVKVQNAEGCWSAKDTIFVTDIPTPLVDFGNDTLICEGTTITLSAPWSSFHSYNWSNSSTFVAITASPLDTYSVTVTNECGISSDTIFVDMIPLPTVNLGVDTAICTGTSLTLFATGSQYDSYLWNDNSTADSLIADTIKTYFVKVSNSCAEANDSISIDLIPIPALTFVDDTLCEGTTITVFAPFSIYHNYLWNTGVTIDSITAFPDSTYWLNVTSDCGTAADTIFIEKIPLPVVNLGVDTAICNGTSLTLFATGSQYDSYLWNDSTTLDSLVADTIKTYSVTVTNSCSTANDSLNLDLIPIPALTFVDDTLCEGTTITVFAPFSIYHNYLWNTGDTIDSITAFPDSLYSVTVSNACDTSSASIFIEKIPLPVVNLGVDTAICTGTNLTLFATGSQYDSYLWNNGSTADTLVADTINTYSVIVSNVCDTASSSISIDLIPIPNVSFVDDTICEGTTITLNVPFSIYHQYLWNTGDTIDSITAFPDSLYYVKISNACGIDSDSIFIEKIPLPVVNLGVDTAICNGTSLTIFATGSQYDSYLWNDGSTLDSLIADTIYTYSVTVSNVCDTANGSKTIDLIPIPNLTFIDDTLCEGTTITIFAPFSIYHNYLWNIGDTIDSITAFPDSTYWLNVTSDCGSANDTIFIEKIPLPVVNLGVDTAICTGTSLTLFATGSQYDSYLWNDSTKLDTLIADSINTYSVTVTNSCFDVIDSVIIDLIPIPDVFLGNDTLICEGTTLLLKADSSIYNTYIWNNDSASISQQTDTISYFAITVTNICGTSTDSINIGLKPNPVINFGNDTTFCENSNITINWIAGYTDYYWDNILALQSITVSVTDTLSLMVRDSVGCFSNVDTIIVTAVYPATANLGIDTTICIGDSLLLTANAGYDSYSWNNGTTNDSLFISQTGTYILEVKNTCNTASDTLNLIVYEIQIELGLDTILCPSETITLDAGSGFTSYKWNDESTNQTLTVNSTGTYFVEVSNICIGVSDTVDVFYLPNSVNLGSDTAICEGNIISFSTPDIFDTLTWHNGFNYPVFTTSKPGTYYLTAENKCGTFSDTIILVVKPIPSVELGPDIAVSFETETLDAGDDATTYLWSTGDSTQTIQVTPGNYAVWVEVDKDGCKASDTIRILYSPYDSGCIFGVPNAFTPNGDNKNDVLHVRGYCIEQMEFMVFNRFGEMVFKSEDINTGWDGKYKGRLQESEVYIWYLKVKLTDGQVVEKTGNVALLN